MSRDWWRLYVTYTLAGIYKCGCCAVRDCLGGTAVHHDKALERHLSGGTGTFGLLDLDKRSSSEKGISITDAVGDWDELRIVRCMALYSVLSLFSLVQPLPTGFWTTFSSTELSLNIHWSLAWRTAMVQEKAKHTWNWNRGVWRAITP